jgi:hypothetical protein
VRPVQPVLEGFEPRHGDVLSFEAELVDAVQQVAEHIRVTALVDRDIGPLYEIGGAGRVARI